LKDSIDAGPRRKPAIARPAILVDAYGTHRYATIAAAMNVPIILAKAAGPLAGRSTRRQPCPLLHRGRMPSGRWAGLGCP
jgi:hypothetical protein